LKRSLVAAGLVALLGALWFLFLPVPLTWAARLALRLTLPPDRVASTRYVCPVFIGALPAMMRLVESRDPKRPLMIWLVRSNNHLLQRAPCASIGRSLSEIHPCTSPCVLTAA
jgi:hypothetical protein